VRLLIVDDNRRLARTLVDILAVKGYKAETACSAPQALEKLAQAPYDGVVADIRMPGGDGVALCRAIRARQPDMPVVLMTAYTDDALVAGGMEAGAIGVLSKPLDLHALLSLCAALRRQRTVVIVNDDPHFRRTQEDIPGRWRFAVVRVADSRLAASAIGAEADVVLLDMQMKAVNGLMVLREIRARYPHLPVILITGHRQEMADEIAAALCLGAYACLDKPLRTEELMGLLTDAYHQELRRALGT